MRSLKHPFGDERSQLQVRGQPRVTMVVIASGVMLNLRRIWRYQQAKREKARLHGPETSPTPADTALMAQWRGALARWWADAHAAWGALALVSNC